MAKKVKISELQEQLKSLRQIEDLLPKRELILKLAQDLGAMKFSEDVDLSDVSGLKQEIDAAAKRIQKTADALSAGNGEKTGGKRSGGTVKQRILEFLADGQKRSSREVCDGIQGHMPTVCSILSNMKNAGMVESANRKWWIKK